MTARETNAALGRATGADLEAARGAWLDRQLGHARSCAALDDPWGAEAYAIEIAAAVEGASFDAWMTALAAASARAWPVRARGAEATGNFARLAALLPRWASERRPAEAAEVHAEVLGAAARLLALDAEIDLARPRYRWRLPWTGAGVAAVHALLAPIFAQAPATAPPVPDAAAALARADAAIAGWRARLRPLAAPVAADAPAVLAACRAAIRAQHDAMLARDRQWPEPLRAHHARALLAAADAAPTATALDVACAHAAACFDIEACWLRALVATVTAPLRAALVGAYEPGPAAEASLAAARTHAAAVAGEPDPARVPWVAELLAAALAPHASGSLDGLGAELGEAGFELLGPWRTWTAVERSAGRPADAPTALALGAVTPPLAPPAHRRIVLWDREVGLDDATALRRAPARPALGTSGGPRPYHVIP